MEQEKFDIWMMEYLSHDLADGARKEFEAFLRDNPKYQENFEKLKGTWVDMDKLEIPKPTDMMDERFFDLLHSEIAKSKASGTSAKSWFALIGEIFWKPQMAYGILMVVLGLSLAYILKIDSTNPLVESTVFSNPDTERVREQLVLTLLEQPSANKRLQGIGEANKINKVDHKVIGALLQTLNYDTNVNVRLAAIESLTNYLDDPIVREGLVQSIVQQDSPIVQVTLANLMVALQEKKSIEPFKTLMRTKELDTTVKHKLETSIKSII